jgi:hypothetical protein
VAFERQVERGIQQRVAGETKAARGLPGGAMRVFSKAMRS